jgi:hypothetical protein
MARYDKYDPISGGFRAPLAADFSTVANFGKVYAVRLNASGQVVIGSAGAQTGIVGVMVLTTAKFAGDAVDIMTHGEIVDISTATPFDNFSAATVATAPAAGTEYYGVPGTGMIDSTATANRKIGWTVEQKRLVVRVAPAGTAA